MKCINRLGVVTVLGLGLLAGCSKSDSSNAGSTTAQNAAQYQEPVITEETDPNTNPIARAAHDFLAAIMKGDVQTASSLLTPTATQRIVASGLQFQVPGIEAATFKIGEVRTPVEGVAIVRSVFTDASSGTPHNEELCCLLRQVNQVWLVSGIAYGTGPGKPWNIADFETGQNRMIPQNVMSQMAGSGNAPQGKPGMQANAGAPPVTPQAPLGPPTAGPANPNSPNPNTAGLGMPAVGAPVNSAQPQAPYQQAPYQQPPYTAQEQQPVERR